MPTRDIRSYLFHRCSSNFEQTKETRHEVRVQSFVKTSSAHTEHHDHCKRQIPIFNWSYIMIDYTDINFSERMPSLTQV